jgi:hypothetical protein
MPPATRLVAMHVGGRVRLLMDNKLVNVGPGPVEFHGHRRGEYAMTATQWVRRTGGRGPVPLATGARLTWKYVGAAHGGHYWKFKDAARFELWAVDAGGHRTRPVRVGPKHDYCLRDLFRQRGGPAVRRTPFYGACSQVLGIRYDVLGISVGWADGYPYSYPQNWIDVTGLRGCYVILQRADPLNHIAETDETDNVSTRMVRLPFDARHPALGCPRYGGQLAPSGGAPAG